MKHHPAAWILIVAAALFTAFPSLSLAEERFGPWAYYAPYYYPPNMVFAGRPLCPEDFAPRYESPNPPQPSNAAPPCSIGQQKPPVKVSSRGMHSGTSGSSDRNFGKSSISTPYVPSRRPERVDNVPSAAIRHSEPTERPASSLAPQASPGNPYLPPAKPTPQLSSPGASAPNQYRPSPQPTAQQTAPKIPDNAFQQLNRPPDRAETPEIPSVTSSPVQRPSFYSAPVERNRNESVQEEQPQAASSSTKKPWMWGRQSPRTNEQRVTPPVSRPGDQSL